MSAQHSPWARNCPWLRYAARSGGSGWPLPFFLRPSPLWSLADASLTDGSVCSTENLPPPPDLIQSRTWMSWDRAPPRGPAWCWLWPLSVFFSGKCPSAFSPSLEGLKGSPDTLILQFFCPCILSFPPTSPGLVRGHPISANAGGCGGEGAQGLGALGPPFLLAEEPRASPGPRGSRMSWTDASKRHLHKRRGFLPSGHWDCKWKCSPGRQSLLSGVWLPPTERPATCYFLVLCWKSPCSFCAPLPKLPPSST